MAASSRLSTFSPRRKKAKSTGNRRQSLAELVCSDEMLEGLYGCGSSLFQEKPPEYFGKKYELGMMIGEGATGRVFIGVCRQSSLDVAVKIIHEQVLVKNSEIIREILILHELSHPNIIRLVDVVLTTDKLYIVMELARGAELFDSIVEKKNYGEQDAAKVISQISSALHYLHSHGVSHRDLKPENILYFSDSPDASIKLVDFGLSTTTEKLKCNMTGTLGYKAPELFKAAEGVTEKNQLLDVPGAPCDMWALGIIAYILLCGFPPFFSEEHFNSPDFQMNAPFWVFFNEETPLLIEQICHREISFPNQFWETVSDKAKDFISRLLEKDPKKRMKAKEALIHPWLSAPPSPTSTPLLKATETLSFFLRKKQKLSKKFEMILESTPCSPSPSFSSSSSFSSTPSFTSSSSPFSSSLPSPSTSPFPSKPHSPNTTPLTPPSNASLMFPSLPSFLGTPQPSSIPISSSCPQPSPLSKNVKGRRMSLVLGRVPFGSEHLISPRIHNNLISLDRAMVKDSLKEKLKLRPGRGDDTVERIVGGKGKQGGEKSPGEGEKKKVARVLHWDPEGGSEKRKEKEIETNGEKEIDEERKETEENEDDIIIEVIEE